ncbi:LOW QUALITY PROTEIN: probable RNA polymerase II nuclear localization protein SLC7A6OS [Procambarus clarkii]|uniref:LOW QUALITY PROTEIN: probable RNA polymerase II nuclear localization protein SLC7A6OS n=1 Tax=Procambarus clarkii TaxID=6728 RepID=UPI003742DD2E
MATLIRIKRRFSEEPSPAIVVESKRLRTEATAADDSKNAVPTILKRVATVNSKDELLKPELLKTIEKEYKKGWELREQYKKLGKPGSYRDTAKLEAKERIKNKRYMVLVKYRGNVDDGEPEEVKEEKVMQDKKEDVHEADETEVVKCSPSPSFCDQIKYYDAEFLSEDMPDVITCNGVPMESEKYVYDIFYSVTDMDWTDYICNVQKYVADSSDDDDRNIEDDDDDENDEDNWRNDYPEEEDSSNEDDDDGCLDKQFRRLQARDFDDSYDADECDEENFNEEGDLIECGYSSSTLKLRKHLSGIVVHGSSNSDDDDDDDDDDDNFDDEGNLIDCKYSSPVLKVGKHLSDIEIDSEDDS